MTARLDQHPRGRAVTVSEMIAVGIPVIVRNERYWKAGINQCSEESVRASASTAVPLCHCAMADQRFSTPPNF